MRGKSRLEEIQRLHDRELRRSGCTCVVHFGSDKPPVCRRPGLPLCYDLAVPDPAADWLPGPLSLRGHGADEQPELIGRLLAVLSDDQAKLVARAKLLLAIPT